MEIYWEDVSYHVCRPYYLALSACRKIIARVRWKFFRNSLEPCGQCGAPAAEWEYVPAGSTHYSCDDCVSRGCDCQLIDRGIPSKTTWGEPREDGSIPVWYDFGDVVPEQRRDERGRLLPCIEYEFCRWGWPRRRQEA